MVIGNGFFSDTEAMALQEMQTRSGCKVERVPIDTIGNIVYFVSEKGDLYGQQQIQGKLLTRTRKPIRNKGGITARLSTAPHKESFFPLQVLTYSAFTAHRWMPDARLDFVNGNPHDVRPQNLRPHQDTEHPEWTATLSERQEAYAKEFSRLCYSTAYYAGLALEDTKDIVSQTFIELCTTGNNPTIKTADDFVGLWMKMSRLRAFDFYHHYGKRFDAALYDTLLEVRGRCDQPYERDLFTIQPGKRRQQCLRMYFEGNTPSEIARELGCSASTVSSSVSRSLQFLQRYFKNEMKYL